MSFLPRSTPNALFSVTSLRDTNAALTRGPQRAGAEGPCAQGTSVSNGLVGDRLRRNQRQVHREAWFLADPVERLVRRVNFSAKLMRARSVSLTASSEENTFATSGLRSTRFVPLLNWGRAKSIY